MGDSGQRARIAARLQKQFVVKGWVVSGVGYQNPPQVIFLDAVGTLFGLRGSVGDIYSDIAAQFGVRANPLAVDQGFLQSFKQAGPPAFPDCDPGERQRQEYTWWFAIAHQTFQSAGALSQFNDFEAFFATLFEHFKTADPWVLYPDVIPSLTRWHQRGVALGVLSNFDSRLYHVLEALNLASWFSSVTLSTETGAAKPDSAIFRAALLKHDCAPSAAWHIGDSFTEDYQAACQAGLRGIWLRRSKDVTLAYKR